MHNRHPPLTTTTTGHDGSVRLELDKQGVGRRMREGIDDKAFPEQGAKVSIHSDGSFEGLGCVLANTNLNVLTAVFYWFTLKRDELFCPRNGIFVLGWTVANPTFRETEMKLKCAILDDYQQVALKMADWSALPIGWRCPPSARTLPMKRSWRCICRSATFWSSCASARR